ncbi:hypothetical protein GKIL_1274 [Gloeobacter kilaueensis JS1]|uniref:IPT/TIG domain-containing protein n=1 Tax=Gloeobacter kilaueensis (strain ATCC BAA-2537 / CCAP 1431/1 / ULC 316 / JS1) TaxID=1183438 RepID=U5QIM3_GLOK1|nr:hypothetical protein GKIL_1274 [Gloeobacter kilaueensis JS1]
MTMAVTGVAAIITSGNAFAYSVTSCTPPPPEIPLNPGATITVAGSGLSQTAQVVFNAPFPVGGGLAPFQIVNDSKLIITVPQLSGGAYRIFLSNNKPFGQGYATAQCEGYYQVASPPPGP